MTFWTMVLAVMVGLVGAICGSLMAFGVAGVFASWRESRKPPRPIPTPKVDTRTPNEKIEARLFDLFEMINDALGDLYSDVRKILEDEHERAKATGPGDA